ncbi:MAG TPA: phenylalanine--tRNA ligase subunit beta, partial [Bacteroidales bacterium]|nr:phenylalanine--tRNA ligase subunit beta [Bacteroidales bacterium]
MKISYNQLKDYIKELPNPKQLAEILTNCGLEVENYEYYSSIPGGLNGIIIAEILDKEKHPNADKLSICKVTDGNNIFNVICGAPNVDKGQKVLFAPIGTNVFRGEEKITIKKISIRGIESEGMICAEDEIGLGNSHYGIVVLPNDVKTGMLASEYFKVYEDTIFEIGLTPNRSDATSYIGVARDIIAVLNLNNYFNNNHNKLSLIIPDVNKFSTKNHDLNIEVEIQNNNCIRYSGVSIKNVKVQDSPKWLKEKLKAIGIRPINNIVDITNFVLFETGQPLHAFDASKIKGNKIIVKSLPSKTNFVTLDGISRELNPEDLMICNESEPMCIAGVFGGIDSGITDNTKDVFLESACFKASSIRKTSKRHSLKTDASFRFERGTDPNITIYALKRAALMICQIAGGYISSEIKDVYPKPIEPIKVFLSYNKLNSIAGTDIINKDIITLILESIQVKILQEQDNGLLLEIPTFK